mmetsp:Transcript_9094/g.11197  ORF Transcript_9094/g.11197 Transcript_9094/m.11197 type:complete len:222 (-) Transcript_9094:508-1173(-)
MGQLHPPSRPHRLLSHPGPHRTLQKRSRAVLLRRPLPLPRQRTITRGRHSHQPYHASLIQHRGPYRPLPRRQRRSLAVTPPYQSRSTRLGPSTLPRTITSRRRRRRPTLRNGKTTTPTQMRMALAPHLRQNPPRRGRQSLRGRHHAKHVHTPIRRHAKSSRPRGQRSRREPVHYVSGTARFGYRRGGGQVRERCRFATPARRRRDCGRRERYAGVVGEWEG